MRWGKACSMNGAEDEGIYVIGGKISLIETTSKNKS
jgi:hypothetical protein